MSKTTTTRAGNRSLTAILLVAAIGFVTTGCGPEDAAVEGDVDGDVSSTRSSLQGGTPLAANEHQTGILRISTYDGNTAVGSCTATVLHSSLKTNQTWLVSAAHCFSYVDSTTKFVGGHFAQPRARVRYTVLGTDCRGYPKAGTTVCWSDLALSTAFQHPEWLANGGHTAWFGPRDIAFIRINKAIPVYDETNKRRPDWSQDYSRPIFAGHPTQVSSPFVPAQIGENVFCGQGSGSLRCDQLTNLWYSPNFRSQFIQLPYGAWTGGFYEGGDSGGPLLMNAAGLGTTPGSGDLHTARRGVVLGVLQGPTVFCDYIQNGNCNPGDGLATHFHGIEGFLTTIGAIGVIERRYQLVDPDMLVYSVDYNHGGSMTEQTFWMPVGGPCHPGHERTRFIAWHSGHGNCWATGWTSSQANNCQVWVLVKNSAGFLNGTCHVRVYQDQ